MKTGIVLLSLFLSLFTHSFACTVVFWNTNAQAKVVARTVDLLIADYPKIMVFPRGMNRHGGAGEPSITWTSKYGSVAVREFNTDAISEGINEHGLAVQVLYLTESSYIDNSGLPKLSNLLWVQYVLDNYKTVNEALQDKDKFTLVETVAFNQKWPLHLSMQDSSGDAAVIEFVQGKKQVYHGPQYTVMTNDPAYNVQLDNLKRYHAFGGTLTLPGGSDPLSRFVRVATYLKTLPSPKSTRDAIAGILSVIRTAMVPFGAVDVSGDKTEDAWPTRWVSVSDLTHKTYYFSSTTTPNIIWLNLNDLDFSVAKPVLFINPDDLSLVGDVKMQLQQENSSK